MAPEPLTPSEASFYPLLFTQLQSSGLISGGTAFEFLTSSGVDIGRLSEIWAIADEADTGSLNVPQWTLALRLIAVAQRGGDLTKEAGERASTVLPKFTGHPPPPPAVTSPSAFGGPAMSSSLQPPLTPEDIAKFKRHFAASAPNNGLLPGEKARDVFVKSKLPYDKLGQIWNLADTQSRGALDQTDFIIGMYFIQAAMMGKVATLPDTLPTGLYETASEGAPAPGGLPSLFGSPRQLSASPAPISRQVTGQPAAAASPISRQITGQSYSAIPRQMTGQQQYVQPQATGGSASGFPSAFGQSAFGTAPAQALVPWDITPAEKTASDRYFEGLDKFGRGILEGDVAVPFMLESKLSETVLASVWDLADIRNEGNLTKDEFAVAMHLIKTKLAGKELPASLPTSMIPPSLRDTYGPQATGQQAPAAQPPVRDLFDAFSDSPPATAPVQGANYFPDTTPATSSVFAASNRGFGMAPFAAAPIAEDLLGEEAPVEPTPAPPSREAVQSPFGIAPAAATPVSSIASKAANPELTNLQTQHAQLTKSVSEHQATNLALENESMDQAKEITDLQAKLVGLRSTYEVEETNVTALRTKVATQAETLKTLKTQLITAEGDLSSLRQEKTDLDGQMMTDKEDIRGMKRRMKEIGDETAALKIELEKVKKDARQQKGMATITKKQLSTAEGEHEKATTALADAHKGVGLEEGETAALTSPVSAPVAANIALPATPDRMLSPALSISSQKSNNPFERLSAPAPATKELTTSPPSATTSALEKAAEFAGGAVAAGAVMLGVDKLVFDDKDKTPEPVKEAPSASSAFDESFGILEPPVAPISTPGASNTAEVQSFDAGFGDDFAAAPTTTGASDSAALANEGFDSAFGDAFEEKSAIASEPRDVPPITTESAALEPSATSPFGADESEEPVTAVPGEFVTPAADEPTAPVALVTTAPVAGQEDDSSDDEDEGPEDLDARPSLLKSPAPSALRTSSEDATVSDAEQVFSSPAPVAVASEAEPSPFGHDESASKSITAEEPAVPAPTPVSPAEPVHRRAAPPPPPRASTAVATSAVPAAITTTDSDPFSSPSTAPLAGFGPSSTSAVPVVPQATAATASPVSKSPFETSTSKSTPFTGFGDEPFAPAPAAAAAPSVSNPPSSTSTGANFDDDFDAEFADVPPVAATASTPVEFSEEDFNSFDEFNTEFDDATPAAGTPTALPSTSTTDSKAAIDSYAVDPSFADFDSAFGDARTTAPAPTGASAFSFDDAFGAPPTEPGTAAPASSASAFDSAFEPTQNVYSPPPGPPPTSTARPTLPARTKTGAEADDIPDVKTIVSMGFSRSEALNALEVGNYNLQKALDHLVAK